MSGSSHRRPSSIDRNSLAGLTVAVILAGVVAGPAWGFAVRPEGQRFDASIKARPGGVVAVAPVAARDLPAGGALAGEWQAFFERHQRRWHAWIDPRTDLPSLAYGRGIEWLARPAGGESEDETLATLERLAREFLERNVAILGSWGEQLVLDREASGRRGRDKWEVVFRQVVDGVPVEGARYEFSVGHGKLVAFGASRWGRVKTSPRPDLDAEAARAVLDAYLGVSGDETIVDLAPAELLLVPIDPRRGEAAAWDGPRGAGLDHVLVWRFRFRVPGEPATWVGEVDAHRGEVFAFYDDTHYEVVRGGVMPISNDGDCANDGCEQPGFPMPFTDVSEDGSADTFTGDHGTFTCSLGSLTETNLVGQFFRVSDNCGAVSESATCDDPIDMGTSPGTNCQVDTGRSAGDTRASRTSFYHLNVVRQKGAYYLPDNTWLQGRVTDNVNIANTCNAFWNGSVNFYREGGGCRNTGEISGVITHEWGHGMDFNDGGGGDNPSEAYADVVAIFESRESCIGRGFFISGTCSGYGDTCLECTGIREMDWDKRASHTPATHAQFTNNNCGGGGGPCGKEVHCESYVPSESIWDLATRDLPASGLDPDTSWAVAERLWWASRDGSGGNTSNCSLPNSDGCGTTSWFHKLRLADDDDGDLDNGTPHAAAIFAAFDRHGIACGAASDPSNQSTSSCPQLDTPVLSAKGVTGSVELEWTEVPNAAEYLIHRNDLGCDRGQVPVATVAAPSTSYLDEDLIDDFPAYYRVEAIGSNDACRSAVSNCVAIAPQARAGSVRIDRAVVSCTDAVTMRLVDADLNVDPDTPDAVTLLVTSTTEPDGEPIVFTETGPSSAKFTATVTTALGPPASDGVLQTSHGDVLTVTYLDTDDGFGSPATVFDTADLDCHAPELRNFRVDDVTDQRLTVRFETDEPGTTVVEWGPTPALGQRIEISEMSTSHEVLINSLDICQPYYLRVESTDLYGNTVASPPAGDPHAIHTWDVPGLFFRDTFEAGAANWTLEGEWETGAPQGLGSQGGRSGLPDPTAAYNNDAVLGTDLSGLGNNPGDYEISISEDARSLAFDASAWTNTKLILYRYLNVDANDEAAILVDDGTPATVFSNSGAEFTESDYVPMSLDLSAEMDGKPNVSLVFRITSGIHSEQPDGSIIAGEYSGWNIDDVILKDGSLPDYAGCGGCGQGPAFRGATSAVDGDACGATGVTVSWDVAIDWGTGSSGTYAVYRDTAPDFTPGPANLIASGLTGTSFLDTTAPADQQVYYVVRAENDETCGTGPANGGVTDSNTVHVAATESTSSPDAGGIADLIVRLVNHAHVRLEWSAPAGASRYNVYRSASPQRETFQRIGGDERTFFEDRDRGAEAQADFYLVRAENACGDEGP